MVSRIYGLADSRRRMPPAGHVGKHRMSGAVAQALWLRSENFFHSFFSLCLGHDSLQFSGRNFLQKFGKKISPQGGPTPKFFFKSIDSSTRAMCLHNLIAISQKLWPVGRDKVREDKQKKQKNKMTNLSMSCPNRKSDRSHSCTVG